MSTNCGKPDDVCNTPPVEVAVAFPVILPIGAVKSGVIPVCELEVERSGSDVIRATLTTTVVEMIIVVVPAESKAGFAVLAAKEEGRVNERRAAHAAASSLYGWD